MKKKQPKPNVPWRGTVPSMHFGVGDLLVSGDGNCLKISRTPKAFDIGSTPPKGTESERILEWYFSNPRSALVLAKALLTIALNYDGQSELFLAG